MSESASRDSPDLSTTLPPYGLSETLPPGFESILESFALAVPVEHISCLSEYLDQVQPEYRRAVVWELIKLDLSEAISNGLSRTIEDYCEALPQWIHPAYVPIDLVLEEQLAKREVGQPVDNEAYLARFPHLKSLLQGLAGSGPLSNGIPVPSVGDISAGGSHNIDEFSLLRMLGRGAFATVYLARQETMQRLVALKLASRVGDEPRALARLDHPNIVRIYDQRIRNTAPTEMIYMEYIPGGTLSELIAALRDAWDAKGHPDELGRTGELSSVIHRTGHVRWSHLKGSELIRCIDLRLVGIGQLAPSTSATRRWLENADWSSVVAWIGYQLALALHYAHSRQVLHRDIKPANVLLTSEGIPKLADFNVSHASGDGNADAEANFGGSLGYMSPEQLRAVLPGDPTTADSLDGRSDLYSLAVVLWELWCGERPWPAATGGRSMIELAELQLEDRRLNVAPMNLSDATSVALGEVLRQTLALDPAERPLHGAEMAAKLRLALYPQAAPIFYPQPRTLRSRLLRMPVWLVTGLVILIPNIVAGVFNYYYNETHILSVYPGIERTFVPLATTINVIAYPLGAWLLLVFTKPISEGIRAVRNGTIVPDYSVRACWKLGNWAAVIGGSIWIVAGVVYPTVLKLLHPEFLWIDAIHFWMSLVVCGGVAWTFPFFLGTACGVLLFYPKLVASKMEDELLGRRIEGLRSAGGRYLITAAMIPLLAAALATNRLILLLTLAATAIGVCFSFVLYQYFESLFHKLTMAIATRQRADVPLP